MNDIRKILIEIKETQSFEKLEPLKKSSVWKKMPLEERNLLAQLLVLQGSHQLSDGNQLVLDSFKTACKISEDNPEILIQQAEILSSYRDNMRCLLLACDLLNRALDKNPHLVKAWILRAVILTDVGLFENEASYFDESNQDYEKAYTLLYSSNQQIDQGVFFWNWGCTLSSLGKLSGEPQDFHQAVEKYHKAYDAGCRNVQFYLDFGLSYADLASLLDKQEYYIEALNLFNLAIQSDPTVFEGWFNQGCCLQCLLEFGFSEDLFLQAEKSFEKAAEINPNYSHLWLNWGQLESVIAKSRRNIPKLQSSLAKLTKAYEIDPYDPLILNNMAEILLFLGSREEKLELLHAARDKIADSLELQADDPSTWYLFGSCFNEMGHYFDDESYYHQAIEKFQYGISITEQHPLLWYGIALSHFAIGELTEKKSFYEKSIRYCSKVIESAGEGFPQFWNDWGVALLKLAELSEDPAYVERAIEKFEKALRQPIDNLTPEEFELEWAYNYGSAYDLLGELTMDSFYFEKAVQILTHVITLDPHYANARYNLALALSHQAEAQLDIELYQKSIEHFQYLINEEIEDELIHLDYAMALTDLGLLIDDVNDPEPAHILYKEAENHFMQAAALGNTQAYYQLAGLYSITGHHDQSMHYLQKSRTYQSLPSIEDLLHDEWLEAIRHTPSFRQFINELSSK